MVKKLFAAAALLLALSLSAGAAQAQSFGQPKKEIPGKACSPGKICEVSGYTLLFTYDRETFNTVDALTVTVQRLKSDGKPWRLAAEILPDSSISALPITFTGDFESGTADVRTVKLNYPISGLWYMHLTVKSDAATADIHSAVFVEAPPKMADWLAWLIGLSPVLGIVGFAYGQWRLVTKRKAEATPAIV